MDPEPAGKRPETGLSSETVLVSTLIREIEFRVLYRPKSGLWEI
jgi:hypothetical protein